MHIFDQSIHNRQSKSQYQSHIKRKMDATWFVTISEWNQWINAEMNVFWSNVWQEILTIFYGHSLESPNIESIEILWHTTLPRPSQKYINPYLDIFRILIMAIAVSISPALCLCVFCVLCICSFVYFLLPITSDFMIARNNKRSSYVIDTRTVIK